MSLPDPTTIWAETLSILQGQMLNGTYQNNLAHTQPLRWLEQSQQLLIACPSDRAYEWLSGRLQDTVDRALQSASGQLDLTVVFQPPDDQPNGMAAKPDEPPDQTAQHLDGIYLLQTSKFIQTANYAVDYWQAYLMTRHKHAFPLWNKLQTYDKQSRLEQAWTTPRAFTLSLLAGYLATSRDKLTGRWTECGISKAGRLDQCPLSACCGKRANHHFYEDTGRCDYWAIGVLDILQQEGLLHLEISGTTKGQKITLQQWRYLPLLTPKQHDQLKQVVQSSHRRWLNPAPAMAAV